MAVSEGVLRQAEDTFEEEYERLYGHRADRRAFELVNIHVVATVDRGVDHVGRWDEETKSKAVDVTLRSVYFGPDAGCLETKILTRPALSASPLAGPIIVEEYDSTVVVPPGWQVHQDELNNIVIQFIGV